MSSPATVPTLAAWCAEHGVLPTHPTTESGAVSVLCPPGTPARAALHRLHDYRVDHTAGPVVWLTPHPGEQWVLVVGNVGVVYHGPDEAAARRLWAEYQDYRPWGVDDVASLVLYRDGEPVDDRPGYPETWEADPEATWFGVGEDGEHHAGFYPDRDDAE